MRFEKVAHIMIRRRCSGYEHTLVILQHHRFGEAVKHQYTGDIYAITGLKVGRTVMILFTVLNAIYANLSPPNWWTR